MRKFATLRQVAQHAGVHLSTASRALNPETRHVISPETTERVLAAAEELGYQPHSLARGLRMDRTMTIGMLVPDLKNPLFPPIVRGIEDVLRSASYTLLTANTDNEEDKEREILKIMESRRVDGLIMATARREYPVLEYLIEQEVPLVLVNRTASQSLVSSVAVDDHAGLGLIVEHLVALGHTRIAHIAGTSSVSTGIDRRNAFNEWMAQSGLTVDDELTVEATWFTEHNGEEAATRLLERDVPFSAVAAANDLLALGCYSALRKRGLSVPSDVSVTGYNDAAFAHAFMPPLTTVRVPAYEMGFRAGELLLRAIRETEPSVEEVRLQPSLVVRESTAPTVAHEAVGGSRGCGDPAPTQPRSD